jgi:hypothetical protein
MCGVQLTNFGEFFMIAIPLFIRYGIHKYLHNTQSNTAKFFIINIR